MRCPGSIGFIAGRLHGWRRQRGGHRIIRNRAGTASQQEPPRDYAIDECLVGVWSTVSQREQTTVNGERIVLIDVERQLRFAADGVEVVTYLDTPAALQSPTGEALGQVTHSGELTYQVSTDQSGTIDFEATGGEVSATFDIRGRSSTLTSDGGSGPVTYTCSEAELTQSALGYEAVFTRATRRYDVTARS